ncbi:hypothetical protein TSST111916_11345 [Tsukamurella strandjordii]
MPRLHPRRRFAPPTLTTSFTLRSVDDDRGRAITWFAYLINPNDAGPSIALTYRLDPPGTLPALMELDRAREAMRGYAPDDTAIVLPSNDFYPAGHGTAAPYITVLDNSGAWTAGWTDLVDVIPDFDLPWWPVQLRSAAAMRHWRPGLPPIELKPAGWDAGPIRSAERLRDDAGTDPAAAHTLQLLIDRWRYTRIPWTLIRLASSVTSAAVAPERPAQPPTRPTREDLTALAHLSVSDLDGEDLLALLAGGVATGVAEHIRVLTPDELTGNAHAQRWRSRLVPAGARTNELGFTIARSAQIGGSADRAHLVDPLSADVWAVEDRTTGVLTYTVGDRASEAHGGLVNAEITTGERSVLAFFTDDNGTAWPVPAGETDEFCVGYDGDGPHRLVRILKLLTDDAAADTNTARQLTTQPNRAAELIYADRDSGPILLRRMDCA